MFTVGLAFITLFSSLDTDYASLVKSIPFYDDYGISATFEDVVYEYIDVDNEWDTSYIENTHYVNVTGTFKGTNLPIYISIAAEELDNNNTCYIYPYVAVIDGNVLSESSLNFLLYEMFLQYDLNNNESIS